MATFQAIVTFFTTLIKLGDKLTKIVQDEQLNSWMKDLESTIDTLEKSESLKDKVAAAKRLSDLVRRL